MKFNYKFANVLGSVYHKGTLEFSPDGNNVYSPVGNKIVCYDLKNNKSQAVPIEVDYNLKNICISPSGILILASTERTSLYMFSTISGSILHRKEFKDLGESISSLGFSPNGQFYVVTGGNKALIYLTPGIAFRNGQRELSPFKIHKVIKAHFDDVTCFDFSSDSRLIAIGSKDLTVKIVTVDKDIINVPLMVNLSGHNDALVKCSFMNDSSDQKLDIISLGRNGQLNIWSSNMTSSDLKTKKGRDEDQMDTDQQMLGYSKKLRQFLTDHIKANRISVKLTSADYNPKGKLLVTGYSNGAFLLQDVPELNVIHSLELSTSGCIDSIKINRSGDWIAIGSSVGSGDREELESFGSSQSQLVVWEWRSESFILKQSGTGAGVSNVTECIAYSPDGSFLATGSTDGKIKLWNTFTGFCFVTFSDEHKGPVTGLEFVPTKGGKVLMSASLDGTVRAFDMNRYRNFRTFTSGVDERPAQFISLAVDSVSGDFVAAGSQNIFEIMLWSQTTGKLCEILSGHTGPVSGLEFSRNSNFLISVSWDTTIRIWDLFQGTKATREIIKLGHDATGLCLNPAGDEFAVTLLNGNISFWDVSSSEQKGVPIEGRVDLGVTQGDLDLSRDKSKYFTTICYSADGKYLFAGGNSRFICVYHTIEKLLVKKFAVTWNLSMDGMYDWISKRKRAEFGFNSEKITARIEGKELSNISLPGVKTGDYSDRDVSPLISVMTVRLSPTMRSFVASTTEGVLLYSLDVSNHFDPYQLDMNVTEESVRESLDQKEFFNALMQSLKLNESKIIIEVLERIPVDEIPFVSRSLSLNYVEKCLRQVALALESSGHLEFYLNWSLHLLENHYLSIKSNEGTSGSFMSVLRLLQRNLSKHHEDLGKLCDHNKYLLSFIQTTPVVATCDITDVE